MNSAVNLMIDFSDLAAGIGAIEGAEEAASSDAYLSDLIRAAHQKAADEFDLQIAADATATRAFNHMYEWGTAGINTGRTTRRMNPLSDEAKLWKHIMRGAGRSLSADYIFEPSKVPVPSPTTASTGISQKYLSKLKKGKAIFWNKASIMESGAPVSISPKGGGKLFIPHNGNPPADARPQDVKRGFTMTNKTVTANPGANTAGTFEAYWQKFWEGRGQEIIQAEVEKYFEQDLEKAAKVSASSHSMQPPSPAAFKRKVAAGKKRGKQAVKSSGQRRNNGN